MIYNRYFVKVPTIKSSDIEHIVTNSGAFFVIKKDKSLEAFGSSKYMFVICCNQTGSPKLFFLLRHSERSLSSFVLGGTQLRVCNCFSEVRLGRAATSAT